MLRIEDQRKLFRLMVLFKIVRKLLVVSGVARLSELVEHNQA